MNNIITLTTDFGLTDEYVGVMKGVILSRAPQANVIDLIHGIAPQDIRQAAFVIRSAYSYFPAGTIHVVVVDPGVGTSRRIIIGQTERHTFIAPDNGVLTLIIAENAASLTAYEITSEELFLKPTSHTFHGRDIMAPVAAALASGVSPSTIGRKIELNTLATLSLPQMAIDHSASTIAGSVVHIDHFGNAMTNIHREAIGELFEEIRPIPENIEVKIKNHTISGLQTSYSGVASGRPLAIFGSRDYLEIGVNGGNASELLDISIDDEVLILKTL